MATEVIDKDYITIQIPKKIGRLGIKRIKDYVKFLETNKDAPKKVSKKLIAKLADEITAGAWEKFKKQHHVK